MLSGNTDSEDLIENTLHYFKYKDFSLLSSYLFLDYLYMKNY